MAGFSKLIKNTSSTEQIIFSPRAKIPAGSKVRFLRNSAKVSPEGNFKANVIFLVNPSLSSSYALLPKQFHKSEQNEKSPHESGFMTAYEKFCLQIETRLLQS